MNNLNLYHVGSGMFCEIRLSLVSFVAFVALERLFSTVRPYVAFQVTRSSTSVVALVTLEWFFSCVLAHHVNF